MLGGLPRASAKTVEEWLEGFETGETWFGEDFAYDITDEEACWELLQRPITVLDAGQREEIYPRVTPGGEKVNDDKLGGFINGASAAVHVLGEDEDGWTLIEGLDYYNRVIRGYVKTSLLKTVTPNDKYGVIIDKLTQRLYVFIDGKLWSSCSVSTGLPNDEQPYNETAAGEYLIVSWVGDFDSEGMICGMALRFNGGDMIHEVPHVLNADGTKSYSRWEALLGQKASHGCVRTQRRANEDGLNAQWLWDNLKRNTKVLVWDDQGPQNALPGRRFGIVLQPGGGPVLPCGCLLLQRARPVPAPDRLYLRRAGNAGLQGARALSDLPAPACQIRDCQGKPGARRDYGRGIPGGAHAHPLSG